MRALNLKKFVVTTILVAVAIVLDLIVGSIGFLKMPMGGNLLGISMIPIVLVGLLFGLQYGLLAGFVYGMYNFGADYLIYISALQANLESWTGTSWSVWHILALIVFDFIIPFTAFGLSGLFHKKNLESSGNIILSVCLVSGIRWLSATLSGVLIWGSFIKYASEAVKNGDAKSNIATKIFDLVNHNLFLYSGIYNFIYIFTTTVVVIIIMLAIRNRLNDATSKYFTVETSHQ